MRNGRMIMKISATVLELTEAYCDHCAIRIQTIAPFATTLELAIDEHIGAGFLADDWHSTFQTGRVIEHAVDFDNTQRVNGFTVDLKRVVEGKSGSDRVALGRSHTIETKKK